MSKQNFLESVASYLTHHHKNDLVDQVVVVPNIRAGLYLRRYLGERMNGPGWAPSIVSIQDFFHQQSGFKAEEPIPLVFELYKCIRNIDSGLFESFDAFYPWGEIILSDFNDIDKNLVNPNQLFANLSDLKKIDLLYSDVNEEIVEHIRQFWQLFDVEAPTHARERFLEVWQHMAQLYSDFHEALSSVNAGYEGMITRHVAENLDNELFPEQKPQHFFVGFNVLSKAEENVFRYFKNHHNAQFFWQYDEHIMKDPLHEAFRFVREWISKFPPPSDFAYQPEIKQKSVMNVYSVSSKTAQAKLASRLIENEIQPVDPDLEHTGLVLPDESLLHPVLFSVPKSVKNVNVTMGYPLSYAPQTSLIRMLSRLQDNYRNAGYYYQDVLRILNHPLIRTVCEDKTIELKRMIFGQSLLRIPMDDLKPDESPLLREVFSHTEDVMEIGTYFSRILKRIYEEMREAEDAEFDKEVVYQMYRNINRFNEYLVRDKIHFQSSKTYLWLVSSMLNNLSVAFSGEPMRGLQVMGMLETRLIDFDKLIVLSMNEGHFPGQSFKKSFIPYNLRRAFGLPTIELQDAIHAYYFYRMIMHPDAVYLIYNSSDEGFNKGEKSRYIQQIAQEMKDRLPLKEIPVFHQTESAKKEKRSLQKDSHALSLLKEYQGTSPARRFSPSQLNTYIRCSMAFYYKYILGLKEPDEMTEKVGNLEFGNVLHNVMCELYEPFVNQTVGKPELVALKKDQKRISSLVENHFREEMKIRGEISGINALGLEAVKKYVYNLLNADIERVPFEYLAGEKKYLASVELTCKDDVFICGLQGTIDRLDKTESDLHIIDYKSGRSQGGGRVVPLERLFERFRKPDVDHAFQVLFYTWLADKQDGGELYSSCNLKPLLYYAQLSEPVHEIKIEEKHIRDYRELLENFENRLSQLIGEIYNPEVPFEMTDKKSAVCENCPYYGLCFGV